MNKDLEAQIEALFTWLLNPPPDDSSELERSERSAPNPNRDPSLSGMMAPEVEQSWDGEALDPLDSEDLEGIYSPHLNPRFPHNEIGEIPAVQDRFQALLKRRIQNEIQSSLPLFPWESEVMEYEDYPSEVISSVVSQPWMVQLKQLDLPVAVELPELLLTQLLDRCQQIAQSTLKEGAKLVQAVEALFPDDFLALNENARQVLLSYRHPGETRSRPPLVYEQADRSQQMRLSLLVARQIIHTLTLTPQLNQSASEREWQTEAGMLQLSAEYRQGEGQSQLRVQALLPCGGSIQLQGGNAQAIAKRPDGGYLSVELFDLTGDRPYSLMVQFESNAEIPLIFAIDPRES